METQTTIDWKEEREEVEKLGNQDWFKPIA
jgi:hypothetical protein